MPRKAAQTKAPQTKKNKAVPVVHPPIGSIVAFGGPQVLDPRWEQQNGYLLCDGRLIDRTNALYADLFNVIGVCWGGDAVNNFRLPDFRGLFLRGVDNGSTGVSGRDPDSAGRNQMAAGGHVGNQVGSFQGDLFASHHHAYAHGDQFAEGGGDFRSMKDDGRTASTTDNGGAETRPKNA